MIDIVGLAVAIVTLSLGIFIGGRDVLEFTRGQRIRRAYRVINKLEAKVSPDVWSDLRIQFANDTMRIIDWAYRRQGVSRTERRQMKRRILSNRAA